MRIGEKEFNQLMIELGCFGSRAVSSDKEAMLIYEAWSFMLECSQALGYDDENVSVGDLKLFLMAIFQIKGNKRLGI